MSDVFGPNPPELVRFTLTDDEEEGILREHVAKHWRVEEGGYAPSHDAHVRCSTCDQPWGAAGCPTRRAVLLLRATRDHVARQGAQIEDLVRALAAHATTEVGKAEDRAVVFGRVEFTADMLRAGGERAVTHALVELHRKVVAEVRKRYPGAPS